MLNARKSKLFRIYAGASFIIKNHSYRETPWDYFDGVVDNVMDKYDPPKHN